MLLLAGRSLGLTCRPRVPSWPRRSGCDRWLMFPRPDRRLCAHGLAAEIDLERRLMPAASWG